MKIALVAAMIVVVALCALTFWLALSTCEAYGCAPEPVARVCQARPGRTCPTPQPVCVRLSASGGCERWQSR